MVNCAHVGSTTQTRRRPRLVPGARPGVRRADPRPVHGLPRESRGGPGVAARDTGRRAGGGRARRAGGAAGRRRDRRPSPDGAGSLAAPREWGLPRVHQRRRHGAGCRRGSARIGAEREQRRLGALAGRDRDRAAARPLAGRPVRAATRCRRDARVGWLAREPDGAQAGTRSREPRSPHATEPQAARRSRCTRRPNRISRSAAPRTCSVSARAACARFPSGTACRCGSTRSKSWLRRISLPASCPPRSWQPPGRPAPARSIRWMRSPMSQSGTGRGSTSMPRTAERSRSRRSCGGICAASSVPTRSRSMPTSGSTPRRSAPSRWSATRGTSRARSARRLPTSSRSATSPTAAPISGSRDSS